jgi:hypothetical protein
MISEFPKISHIKKRAFLAAYSRCGSLSMSAKRAKVDRRTHYNWLNDDPAYVQAFKQAKIEAGDSLQDKLTEMAFEGNVTAAIFLLKGLKPEQFRDRQAIDLQWDGDPGKLSIEQLAVLEAKMIERACGGDLHRIEEFRRELEAGPVVIDGTAEVVHDTSDVPESE